MNEAQLEAYRMMALGGAIGAGIGLVAALRFVVLVVIGARRRR